MSEPEPEEPTYTGLTINNLMTAFYKKFLELEETSPGSINDLQYAFYLGVLTGEISLGGVTPEELDPDIAALINDDASPSDVRAALDNLYGGGGFSDTGNIGGGNASGAGVALGPGATAPNYGVALGAGAAADYPGGIAIGGNAQAPSGISTHIATTELHIRPDLNSEDASYIILTGDDGSLYRLSIISGSLAVTVD